MSGTADTIVRLRELEAAADASYGRMYDAGNPTTVAAHYSDAKEYLADAIGMAQRLGLAQEAVRLVARRDHIKAVYRSQFQI